MMKKLFITVFFVILTAALFLTPCVTAYADAEETGMDLSSYYLGDVDGSGKVNAGDARAILRQAARLQELDPVFAPLGDVNGDGSVKAGDARLALRMAARLDSLFTYAQGYHEHEFSEVVTQEPTCSEKGKKTLTCALCGYQTEADIPKTAHDLAPATLTEPATCRVCGETEGKPLSAQMKLQPSVTSIAMKQYGVAVVFIEELFPEEAYGYGMNYIVETSSDRLASGWIQDTEGNYTDYILIYADAESSGEDVTVYVADVPEVRTKIHVTVGSSGSDKYTGKGPFTAVPDYGVFLKSALTYIGYSRADDGTEGFHFDYSYNELVDRGLSDKKIFDDFDAKLESAGFRYQGELEDGGLYYEKDGIVVTFVYYYQDDAIEISVYR